MIRQVQISDLVRDPTFHPRQGHLSPFHVASLRDSLQAGVELPPILVCQETMKVLAGWHRTAATEQERGPEAVIVADLRLFKNDAARFEAALADSSDSKLGLTSYNQSASVLRAQELGISDDRVAELIQVPPQALRRRVVVANVQRKPGVLVALKRSNQHLAGQTLTDEQEEANRSSDGRPAQWHARQLIIGLQAKTIPVANGDVQNLLKELRDLLVEVPEIQDAA